MVRAWRRSGQSARVFAAEHGISQTTLFKWAQRERDATVGLARAEVGLVEVVPVGASASEADGWWWEVETRGGVVRGRSVLDAQAFSAIVSALGKVGR